MGAEATLKMLLLGEDRSAGKALKGVGTEAEKTGKGMGTFAKVAAAGLVAVAGAATAFGKASVDAYTEAAKESLQLARVTGMTITQASQLRFAGEETGVSFTTMSKSMQIFSRNQSAAGGQMMDYEAKVKAAAATGKTYAAHMPQLAAAFAQLGISTVDAAGHQKSMNQTMMEVADQFKKMPDGPTKTALAMKLFGKGGADMIKTLNKGSEGLKELAAESDKTGNTISNTDAYKQQIAMQRKFHASINGLKIQVGQALMPLMTKLATYLAEHVGPAFQKVTGFVRTHGTLIRALVPVVMAFAGAAVAVAVGTKLWAVYTKVAAAVSKAWAAAQWLLNAALDANPIGLVVIGVAALIAVFILAYKKIGWFRTGVNAVWGFLKKLAGWFAGVFVAQFKIGAAVFKWVMTKAGEAIGWVKTHWKLLLAILTGPFGLAVGFVVSHFGQIKTAVGNTISWVITKFGNLVSFVSGLPGKIGRAVGGMFDGIKNAFRSAIDWIIDGWNGLHFTIPGVNTHIPGVGKIGGFTLNTPDIPRLATGGIVSRPTVALIGEAGPEAIVPLSGPNARRAGMGDGFLGTVEVVVKTEDGREIQRKLLQVKRGNGGLSLGLS